MDCWSYSVHITQWCTTILGWYVRFHFFSLIINCGCIPHLSNVMMLIYFCFCCFSETQQGIFDAVLKGHIDFDSDPWPLISDSAKDLIRKMLCSNPQERLTAHQVLCEPVLTL